MKIARWGWKTERPKNWTRDGLVPYEKDAEIALPSKSVASMLRHIVDLCPLAASVHENLTFHCVQTEDMSK